VIDAVAKAKPGSLKGTYLQSCTISSTMSPGVRVDVREFAAN
jgi:large subunit ribosomal protein L1